MPLIIYCTVVSALLSDSISYIILLSSEWHISMTITVPAYFRVTHSTYKTLKHVTSSDLLKFSSALKNSAEHTKLLSDYFRSNTHKAVL